MILLPLPTGFLRRWLALGLLGSIGVLAAPTPAHATGAGVGAAVVNVGGTGAALGGMERIAAVFNARHPETPVEIVPGLGSTGGIQAMLAGVLDIALVSRNLRDQEIAEGAVARAYGKTPLLLATHPDNAVDTISLDRLAEILRGDVTHWEDGTAIRLVLRPIADSDTSLLAGLSPELATAVQVAHTRAGLMVAATDQDTADALTALPGSLGTSTAALIQAEKRPLKMLALDGVAPTPANLESHTYPLSKTFSMVTGEEVSQEAQTFIDFVWSEEGRAILAESGHLWVGRRPSS